MNRNDTNQAVPTTLYAEATELAGFRQELIRVLGPVLGGGELAAALGYRTADAFGKAARGNRLPIPTFEIAGRRGRYAMTVDLANWLWSARNASLERDPS